MEVGEYIRTQNGRIGRVIKIWVWEGTSKRKEQTHYLIDWGGKASYIAILKNLKHSKNLIDLIQIRRLYKRREDNNIWRIYET